MTAERVPKERASGAARRRSSEWSHLRKLVSQEESIRILASSEGRILTAMMMCAGELRRK